MMRKWDIKDAEVKRKCIDELLTRIEEQDGSEFGMIAAQEIIDIVAEHLGPAIHKSAIEEAEKTIRTKLADLELDLDLLKTSS